MFYGNINRVNESTVDYTFDYFYAESVVTTEYNNRCAMLEACTDPDQKVVLEAQCEILKEVSIKDAFKRFWEAVKGALLKVVRWLKGLLSKGKDNKLKAKIRGGLEKVEKALEGVKKEDVKEEELKAAQQTAKDVVEEVNKAVEESGENLPKMDNPNANYTFNSSKVKDEKAEASAKSTHYAKKEEEEYKRSLKN